MATFTVIEAEAPEIRGTEISWTRRVSYTGYLGHGNRKGEQEPRAVVLNLGSNELQGFGESVPGVRRVSSRGSAVWFTPLVCALLQYIVIYICFEFEE